MTTAIVVFVLVYVTILEIFGWINVWQEAKVRAAAQNTLDRIILQPEERCSLFNRAHNPMQD